MTRKHTPTAGFFHCTLALVITWILIGAPSLHAQKSGPTENEVKSAYLYNFGKFVEWPAKRRETAGCRELPHLVHQFFPAEPRQRDSGRA